MRLSTAARKCMVATLGWLLLTPPYGGPPWSATMGAGCADPGHMNECAPLSYWYPLGKFADLEGCKKGRDRGIAAASNDDIQWAAWQTARCFSEERVRRGPGLLPGE